MGKGRDAYDLILRSLRRRIELGDVLPGAPVAIDAIAEEFRTSVTPVREALAFLAGEGLVIPHRGRGFVHATYSPEVLVDLYGLHHGLVRTALRAWTAGSALGGLAQTLLARQAEGADGAVVGAGAASLFWTRLVATARNAELVRSHWTLTARLGPARRAEALHFEDGFEELAALATLIEASDSTDLNEAIARYHLRRRKTAVRLSELILPCGDEAAR